MHSDAGHGIGNGHGGQAAATIKSIVSNAGHGIFHTLVIELLGDEHGAGILGVTRGHFRRIPFGDEIIVDAIYLTIVGAN